MSTKNVATVETYNLAFDEYIRQSPQVVLGELKTWIDDNLSNFATTAKILEIGSGSGKDADYFMSRGYNVELTDASESSVKYLKENGHRAQKLNILTDTIDFGYDMIFANAVFLHFTEKELLSVLKKTYSAIKSSGRLVFTLKVGEGEELTSRKLNAPRYFHYWQQDEVEKMLKSVGFSHVDIKIVNDFRVQNKPDWLYITATKID